MLCRLAQVRQASFFHGVFLDASPPFDDDLISAEVDVGRREIAEALVVPVVVVVGDEGLDLPLQIARQKVVLQQDPVLQGLVLTLDLALGPGMVRCAPDMAHAPLAQPVCEIAGDVTRAIVAQQAGFVDDLGLLAARGFQRQAQRVGDVTRPHGGAKLPGDHVA